MICSDDFILLEHCLIACVSRPSSWSSNLPRQSFLNEWFSLTLRYIPAYIVLPWCTVAWAWGALATWSRCAAYQVNQTMMQRQIRGQSNNTHATNICATYSSKFLPQPQGRLEPLILPFNSTGFVICRDYYYARMILSDQDLASDMLALLWPSYLKVGRGHYRGPSAALRRHTYILYHYCSWHYCSHHRCVIV